MTDLLRLFANNLLPILLVAAVGYVLAARLGLAVKPLALTTFHAFTPCLIFSLITGSRLAGDEMVRMSALAVVVLLSVAVLAAIVGKALRLPRRMRAALVLVAMLPNAGNYGLSLSMLAFGEPALAQASVFFATSAALTYTVGVFVASLGNTDLRAAIVGLLRVPTIYAVVLAIIFSRAGWQLPLPLERSVDILAAAAIPSFLIVLGMQLHRAGALRLSRAQLAATGLRLVVSPAIALVLVALFGLAGPARSAAVVEAAMPTAVITTVLAETYDVEPAFVTSVVLATTLASPLTLTPLLAWLTG